MKKIVISSGYFDPIHKGHIDYLKRAKSLFEDSHHIVVVNNDMQVFIKRGFFLIPEEDRFETVQELRCVDEAYLSIDIDRGVCDSLEDLAKKYSKNKLYFAKGATSKASDLPENCACKKYGIEIISGLGEKVQSSSDLIDSALKNILEAKKRG